VLQALNKKYIHDHYFAESGGYGRYHFGCDDYPQGQDAARDALRKYPKKPV